MNQIEQEVTIKTGAGYVALPCPPPCFPPETGPCALFTLLRAHHHRFGIALITGVKLTRHSHSAWHGEGDKEGCLCYSGRVEVTLTRESIANLSILEQKDAASSLGISQHHLTKGPPFPTTRANQSISKITIFNHWYKLVE